MLFVEFERGYGSQSAFGNRDTKWVVMFSLELRSINLEVPPSAVQERVLPIPVLETFRVGSFSNFTSSAKAREDCGIERDIEVAVIHSLRVVHWTLRRVRGAFEAKRGRNSKGCPRLCIRLEL